MTEEQIVENKGNKIITFFMIAFAVLGIALIGWAKLTKAGTIPNWLGIEKLEKAEEKKAQFPDSNQGRLPTAWKPVIYLYPKKEELVRVELQYPGKFTVTYPDYDDGWEVIAYPDGKLINFEDNNEYSYLFWEGEGDYADYDLSTGFVVKGKDTVEFLQEKLGEIGLTPKEYNEFIVYWMPKMKDYAFNLIHFATKEEYDKRIPLIVDPKPDSMLRVFMVYKKIDAPVEVIPQEFSHFEREGFSVVEWGGTEIE